MPDDAVRAPERAFLHALAKKYLVGAAGAKGCNELGPTGGLCKKDALKQTTLELLEQVVLQDAKVEHAGESGAIRATAPAIVDLDLTGNPLAGWQEVLGIASQLDHLRFYSLVRVPLPPPTPTLPSPEAIGTSFRALRTLVLNETGLTFASACAICVHLPQLEELQLGDHDIDLASAVTAGGWPYPRALASTFPALRTLLLENARVTRWSDAWALRLLPRLETLSLNKNPIDTVEYVLPDDGGADGGAAAGVGAVGSAPDAAPDAAGEEPLPFAQLKHLFMLESHLSDWRHVDQFDRFPALREIRLQDAPVVRGIGASVARQILIARVGKITALNGAAVNRREREAAERYYLRHSIEHYPEELPEPLMVRQEDGSEVAQLPDLGEAWAPFLAANARWRSLVAIHGLHSAQLPRTAEGGKTLAMQLVNLTLKSVAGESNDQPPAVRKLPTSLQVAKLKLVCCQVFKLDPLKQRLFYMAPGEGSKLDPGFMEPLEDGMRQLAFYGVADGGTIVMDEWDTAQLPEAQPEAQP